MIPYKNSVSLRFHKTWSLTRCMNCNSDNSVQIVIFSGNTCIIWQNYVPTIVSTLNLALLTVFRHETSAVNAL